VNCLGNVLNLIQIFQQCIFSSFRHVVCKTWQCIPFRRIVFLWSFIVDCRIS